MKKWHKKLPSEDAVVYTALLLGFAGFSLFRVISTGEWWHNRFPNLYLVFAVWSFLAGMGLWFQRLWGFWLTIVGVGLAPLFSLFRIAMGNFHPMNFLGLGFGCWGVYQLWKDRAKLTTEAEGEIDETEQEPSSKTITSLVLLLREPFFLDETILLHLIPMAWGITAIAAGDDSSTGEAPVEHVDSASQCVIVASCGPGFLCVHPLGAFAVNSISQPYFEDVSIVASSIQDLRTREAVLQHNAWVSADLLSWIGEDRGEDQAYRLIGQMLAEFVDENCLAVVDVAGQQAFPHDPEIDQKLRSDDPRKSLRQSTYAPVVGVAGDDERMLAAIAEARREWPQFVSAFENRAADSDDLFSVKAEFSDASNAEFMWVSVPGIENDIIYGTLGNDPVYITSLQLDSRVRVNAKEIVDWMYEKDGDLHGGFSLKALRDIKQPKDSESS